MIYFYGAVICLGVLLIILATAPSNKKSDYADFLEESRVKSKAKDFRTSTVQAINTETFQDATLRQRIEHFFKRTHDQIGEQAIAKVAIFLVVASVAIYYLNATFFRFPLEFVLVPSLFLCSVFTLGLVKAQERKKFEETFPDALNMLASAISAGESVLHAIMFVGKTLDGKVGREFRIIGERLQVGESIDAVFKKSLARYPYPSFHFFAITLQANMQRGGQLKDVITRLNRLMFDARALEKKKMAMTSEARTSAKIVAAIPFIFLFLLQYLQPENFEFVMHMDEGKPILYYLLISEAIGIAIIQWLLRGVK